MGRGWTFDEVAGLDLTYRDQRDLQSPPVRLGAVATGDGGASQVGTILASARTVIPDDSISRAGGASIAPTRAPYTAPSHHAPSRYTQRSQPVQAAAPRGPPRYRQRHEFVVGQPCPPLLPQERRHWLGGHLSVTGVCGACCLPAEHRRASCPKPISEYDPARPAALLTEMANGQRLVGGQKV